MKEVKIAKKGSIIAEFQIERTDALTEMFENVQEHEIYPTTKFFVKLDNAVKKALTRQKKELLTNKNKQYENNIKKQ